MKNLSFFVSAFALCASTSYAAINCGTLPTCSDLGYTDKVAECPSSSEVLKCPFDTAYGKCTKGPSVGDLKYSLNTANHNGWILCDGQGIDKTKYAELFKIIGTNYGSSGNNFRVPDYRGFFLRAYGTATNNNSLSSFGGSANSSLTAPQKEQLPNASFSQWVGWTGQNGTGYPDGSGDSASGTGCDRCYPRKSQSVTVNITLSNGNSIYTTNSHVIPANYAANIFIYAGR